MGANGVFLPRLMPGQFFIWKRIALVSHLKSLLMTAIETMVGNNRKAGVRRMVRHNLKIDMTPMVDLGFLLISFFIITTELSKPRAPILNMPKDGGPSEIADSKALTVLIGKNDRLFYYHGNLDPGGKISETTYSYDDGLGKIIREKQAQLFAKGGEEERKGLMLLIKAGEEASYENVIDILDEVLINDVRRYAVLKLESSESNYLKANQ